MRGYPRTFTEFGCFDGYRIAASSVTVMEVRHLHFRQFPRFSCERVRSFRLATALCNAHLLRGNGEQNGYPKYRPTGT